MRFSLLAPCYVYTTHCPEGVVPFCSVQAPTETSYILEKPQAEAEAIPFIFACRALWLGQPTALSMVGLTAKVSHCLAQHTIPCNVVAAYAHDYFFVPEHEAQRALELLNEVFAQG
ncbi:MAG: ACT domain-containing protein [Flavobacteriaceae bacterium]